MTKIKDKKQGRDILDVGQPRFEYYRNGPHYYRWDGEDTLHVLWCEDDVKVKKRFSSKLTQLNHLTGKKLVLQTRRGWITSRLKAGEACINRLGRRPGNDGEMSISSKDEFESAMRQAIFALGIDGYTMPLDRKIEKNGRRSKAAAKNG